jgi:hypothetical protein
MEKDNLTSLKELFNVIDFLNNVSKEDFIRVMEKYGAILLASLREVYDTIESDDVDGIAPLNTPQDMTEKYYNLRDELSGYGRFVRQGGTTRRPL